jgi:hypothetical protein
VTSPETLPDEIAVLQTALIAERAARQQAEARASGAEAMVAYLKLLIAKMKRERFGQSAERGRQLLDQLELQLEELEASATEDEVAAAGRPRRTPPQCTALPARSRYGPHCRLTCRASAWSCRRRVPARVAAAGLSSSARTSPRPSKSCRGNGR